MKIAELINSLEIGGAERVTAELAAGLSRRGHSVHILCLRREGPLAAPLRREGVVVKNLNKAEGFSLGALRRVIAYIRCNQIDLIHTHNPVVHHYGSLAGWICRKPVVSTLHGPGNLTESRKTRWLYDASCLLSSRVVSVGDTVQAALNQLTMIASRRSQVIPNGIPVARFANAPRRRAADTFTFGAVGRLAAVKDHRTMLEAFALVHQRFANSRLDILGDGPLYGYLTYRAKELGVDKAVHFHRSGLDVPGFLAQVHVFVLSSVYEGLPLSLLEAMAAGLPVISTAVGDVPAVLRGAGCGWLTPPGDARQLSEAMAMALESPDLADLGRSAYEYITRRYSTDSMTEAYERLFVSLVRSGTALAVRTGEPA